MKFTVGSARFNTYGAKATAEGVASVSTTVAQARPRRPYIAAAGVQPSVSWWCLLRKGAGCVSRCKTNLSCYATCAPEALQCFK
jgi:hypothetical protein